MEKKGNVTIEFIGIGFEDLVKVFKALSGVQCYMDVKGIDSQGMDNPFATQEIIKKGQDIPTDRPVGSFFICPECRKENTLIGNWRSGKTELICEHCLGGGMKEIKKYQ